MLPESDGKPVRKSKPSPTPQKAMPDNEITRKPCTVEIHKLCFGAWSCEKSVSGECLFDGDELPLALETEEKIYLGPEWRFFLAIEGDSAEVPLWESPGQKTRTDGNFTYLISPPPVVEIPELPKLVW